MCEKILGRIPALTAEERLQLRENCQRAMTRSKDRLVVLEAQRILDALDARERREARVLARLPAARRIEFAFRRLPADDGERQVLQMLCTQEAERRRVDPGRAADAALLADRSVWHRKIDEICRLRRHLLRPAGEQPEDHAVADATPGAGAAAWAVPLLAIDDGSGDIRFRPEAISAFVSLGYVANDGADRVRTQGGERPWAAAAE